MSVYTIVSFLIGIILLSYGLMVFSKKINGINTRARAFTFLLLLGVPFISEKDAMASDYRILLYYIMIIILLLVSIFFKEKNRYDILFVSVKNAAALVAQKYTETTDDYSINYQKSKTENITIDFNDNKNILKMGPGHGNGVRLDFKEVKDKTLEKELVDYLLNESRNNKNKATCWFLSILLISAGCLSILFVFKV